MRTGTSIALIGLLILIVAAAAVQLIQAASL